MTKGGMTKDGQPDDDPVIRLKSALEFLREEADRLELGPVGHAISRALAILCAQRSGDDRGPSSFQ